MDPAYAAKVGGNTGVRINWPEDSSAQFQGADDDDDLYS